MLNANAVLILLTQTFFIAMFGQVAIQKDADLNILNLGDMKTTAVIDEVRFEGVENSSGVLKYSQIKGSPFWNDEWNLASLYDYDYKLLGRVKVKLNFVTQELYFLNKEEKEQVAQFGFVKKIVIHNDRDTSRVLTVFHHANADIFINKKPVEAYLQELNQGDVQLLKLTKRIVASADSLFGTMKRYFFRTEVYYFICFNDKTEYMKRLTKENIFLYVPGALAYTQWIDDNKISFKKEEDIVLFLNYLNSDREKKKDTQHD
ncbi:MAG: hypothetical protein M3O67_10175 [Bacteroidota bacterium]|nr:hypothetical protein [Bacteroidota bacterium]